MEFNKEKFAKFCRTVTQSEIAEKLGLKSRQLVSHRLRNLDKLTVVDFLAICELIDEQPETFIDPIDDCEYRVGFDERMPTRDP